MRRTFKALKALVAVCSLVFTLPAAAQEGTIIGTAQAVDGDTLLMTGTSVRLFGIDAPEREQPCKRDAEDWACGEASKQRLAELVKGQSISCERHGTDKYGRAVAVCFVDEADLARAIVEQGLAIALPEFSENYVKAASRARQHKLGIWADEFQTPTLRRRAGLLRFPIPIDRKNALRRTDLLTIRAPRARW